MKTLKATLADVKKAEQAGEKITAEIAAVELAGDLDAAEVAGTLADTAPHNNPHLAIILAKKRGGLDPDVIAAYEAREDERIKQIAALAEKERHNLMQRKILHDNLRRAAINEILPVFVEIWNTYAGKKYGEKTREAISAKLRERTGAGVYVTKDTADFTMRENGRMYFRYNDLVVYGLPGERYYYIAPDNTIQEIVLDDLKLSHCAPYVDNPAAQARKIYKAYKRMKTLEADFHRAMDELNTLIPSGIDRFYTGHVKTL